MARETGRPSLNDKPNSDRNHADTQKSSIVSEDVRSLAAGLAQKLREANIDCEILPVVPIPTTAVRRDRVLAVLGLTFLTASAWAYLTWISVDMAMGGMDMAGYRMIQSGIGLMMPSDRPWQPIEFAFVFAMWVVMMAAMMTPSAAPMILMYARVGQFIERRTTPLVATICFSGGYFLVWVAFALLATMAQWALERAALLDSATTSTSNVLGGLVFVAVGGYQWTRLKDLCLAQCQKPFAFLVRQGAFRPNAPGSLMLGLRHGAYCLGCCWALMALLFVGGVMNMLWIVALTLLILVEKVTPFGRQFAAVAGTVLIATGAWLLSTVLS